MIKTFFIIIIILTSINSSFQIKTVYFDFFNDERLNNSVCNNSLCSICGQNSISCTFISYTCEVRCNCMLGFNGSKCEYILPSYASTKSFSKHDLWSVIHSQMYLLDITSVLQNMIYLLTSFKSSINEYDIYNTYLIFDGLNQNITFSTEGIELLFDYIDLLISCNNRNSSIFLNANQLYNFSAIGVVNLLDKISTKHVISNNNNSYMLKKLDKFQVLLSSFNAMNTPNVTKLVDASIMLNNEFAIEMDSISLNETILRREFNNDTLKIILKIFYTVEKSANQTLILESNETSFSLKSNLFFDIVHPIANAENKEPYIISSTILSAILIHRSKVVSNITNSDKYEKLVRLQFTIKSKPESFQQNLKCVYWDDKKLDWSTAGCFKSRIESVFLANNKYYRQVCYCNHLTNFALLFDPNPYSLLINEEIDDFIFNYVLSVISYIGIIVSLVCYFIMIITRLFSIRLVNETNAKFYKNLKIFSFVDSTDSNSSSSQQVNSRPNKNSDYILRHLYLANILFLFLANITFILLTLIKRKENLATCIAIGLSLQYLLLASFCFSLGIAYQHFIKLVLVFSSSYSKKKFVFKWFLSSIIAPIPLVFLAYYYDLKHERNSDVEYCWLLKPYLYYFFIIPIILLLLISFTFYIICVSKICNLYCKCKLMQNNIIDISSSYNHKYVMSLLLFSMLSLSLTWLFGIFIVISSNLNNKVFNYLAEFFFCLFNSFHGISLLFAQYMAQKYSCYKSHYHLNTSKSTSSASACTSLDTQQSKKMARTCKLFPDIFSSGFLKNSNPKPMQEINLYNCIHVNNYNYSTSSREARVSNSIDKNVPIHYSFYHNNVNFIINSQDDLNRTINLDYFINLASVNKNDKVNKVQSSKCYVVSSDAYTSSL